MKPILPLTSRLLANSQVRESASRGVTESATGGDGGGGQPPPKTPFTRVGGGDKNRPSFSPLYARGQDPEREKPAEGESKTRSPILIKRRPQIRVTKPLSSDTEPNIHPLSIEESTMRIKSEEIAQQTILHFDKEGNLYSDFNPSSSQNDTQAENTNLPQGGQGGYSYANPSLLEFDKEGNVYSDFNPYSSQNDTQAENTNLPQGGQGRYVYSDFNPYSSQNDTQAENTNLPQGGQGGYSYANPSLVDFDRSPEDYSSAKQIRLDFDRSPEDYASAKPSLLNFDRSPEDYSSAKQIRLDFNTIPEYYSSAKESLLKFNTSVDQPEVVNMYSDFNPSSSQNDIQVENTNLPQGGQGDYSSSQNDIQVENTNLPQGGQGDYSSAQSPNISISPVLIVSTLLMASNTVFLAILSGVGLAGGFFLGNKYFVPFLDSIDRPKQQNGQ